MSDTVTIWSPQPGGLVKPRVTVRVQVREKWGDSWATEQYLTPRKATEAAAPAWSQALLDYHYGEQIKREDSSAFAGEMPLDILGRFVRIQLGAAASGPAGQVGGSEEPVTLWTGILTHEDFDVHGGADHPQGDLRLRAYGLELLLDRVVIRGAYVAAGADAGSGETEAGPGGAVYLEHAPTFNERYRRGVYEVGNKAAGSALFGDDDSVWSNYDIASYLLTYFGPAEVEFKLAGQAEEMLADIEERHRFEGLSLRQALNTLIPRSRGMGWVVRLDDTGRAAIHVFSLIGEKVTVGGKTVPANGERVSWVFDEAQDIQGARIAIDEMATYDRIVVQGERLRSMFSLSIADGTLEKGWGNAHAAVYRQGAESEDARENDNERKGDRFHRVYSLFRVPPTWDWKVGDGSGFGGANDPANPRVMPDGEIKLYERGPYWTHGVAFLRDLLLERSSGGRSSEEAEYESPLAVIEFAHEDAAGEPTSSWAQVENLDAFDFAPAYLRMGDREGSVILRTHTPHTLALGDWTQAETGDPAEPAPTRHPPEVSYTRLIVTVAVETDSRIRVEVVTAENLETDERERLLVIQVRDAHAWTISPGTVVAVANGKLLRRGPEVLRTDLERLEGIAAYARAWYGQQRATVNLEVQAIRAGLRVGTYVVDASSATQRKDIGTPITERRWDFNKMRTSWQTAYTEHDWSTIA